MSSQVQQFTPDEYMEPEDKMSYTAEELIRC
jgi:hypothetical protein